MLVGNVKQCVDLSIAIFSCPISSNCFVKCSAGTSLCNWTHVSGFKANFFICYYRTDDLKHALSWSAGVERGIFGNKIK